MLRTPTPLAWLNLTHSMRKLSAAVGGIGFAVVLMFMQVGFWNGLLDSTVKLLEELNGELLIMSSAQYSLTANQRFESNRLLLAETAPGVQGAYPLYMEPYTAVLQEPRRKGLPIRVLATQLDDPVFVSPWVKEHRDSLLNRDVAIIDNRSKSKYRIPFDDPQKLLRHQSQLNGRDLQLGGAFSLGADFANDGNLLMSAQNFARYFPYRASGGDPLTMVDVGVVKLEEGADILQTKARIARLLPEDAVVYTKEEYIAKEKKVWSDNTPIGAIFMSGLVMGFVVGVIICYQVIYTNISDHMAEFATLKAMGYRSPYFISVVLFKSFYLSMFGFLPGLLFSYILYGMLANLTGLLLTLTVWRCLLVYAITLSMCVVSGCLAVRKLLDADPAELF